MRQARLGELELELRELSQRLKSAREGGSSADDVEWDDVRDRQASVTAEISRIEQELRVCQIVDPSKMATDRVAVGMAVRLKDLNNPDAPPSVYAMVGDREGDPMRKRLSPQSPLGAALLGAVVGQEVGINTPRGPRRYRVLAIAPAPVG